jgi:hypothetical protein
MAATNKIGGGTEWMDPPTVFHLKEKWGRLYINEELQLNLNRDRGCTQGKMEKLDMRFPHFCSFSFLPALFI